MLFCAGNIGQFFNRHGSDFQKDVAVNYGSVVKLHGPFGVSVEVRKADSLTLNLAGVIRLACCI